MKIESISKEMPNPNRKVTFSKVSLKTIKMNEIIISKSKQTVKVFFLKSLKQNKTKYYN